MQRLRHKLTLGCILLGLFWGSPGAAIRTGSLLGRVTDDQGEALSAVTLTLTGPGAAWVCVSSLDGRFWFLGLDPGLYRLEAELEGFSSVEYPGIKVYVGRGIRLEVTLNAAVEDVITVTAESPVSEERIVQTSSNAERSDLEEVPRQADLGSVVGQTAGVIVEASGGDGRPLAFAAQGSITLNNVVALDGGAPLASMALAGPAPDFSDLGSFEEVQIVTGGSDAATPTSGVQVNLVTRRGTNDWRGSGRYFQTPASGQRAGDPTPNGANGVDKIEEYGLEGGGLLLEDRFWAWGALGRRRLGLVAAGGQLDATAIDSETVKLNAQLGDSDSAVLSVKEGDNQENGRGAGFHRAREATWSQRASERLWSAEESHLFNSWTYLTGSISSAAEDLALVPLSASSGLARQDRSGVWHDGFYSLVSDRRADQLRVESSRYLDLVRSDHELRIGGSFVREEVDTGVVWPGTGVASIQGENFGLAGGPDVAVVTREGRPSAEILTGALWFQDTLELGNLTANIGLRFDSQEGSNEAGEVAASQVRPDLLPALRFEGDAGDDPSWLDLSPRIGVTWGVGEAVSTRLRASYARFAERLSSERVLRTHPLALASALHLFDDLDGDQILDPGELGPLFFCDACAGGGNANHNARSLEASLTDELTAEVEHAFRPELTGSLRFVYRRLSRIPEERVLVDEGGRVRVATRGDYRLDGFVTGTRSDGTSYRVPYFALLPGLRPTGGTLLVNGDREQEYRGVSLMVFKRLADRWMLRGHATWSDWTWQVPESFRAFDDPTDVEDPGDNQDAAVAERLSAALGEPGTWLGGRWTFDVVGLYKVAPDRFWGFDVSGRIAGQEGSPRPLFQRVVGSDGIVRDVAVTEFDDIREEELLTVDLRLAKELSFGAWDATLSLDTFNLFDRAPVLVRERNQSLSTAGAPSETALPRTFRWGLAVRFH